MAVCNFSIPFSGEAEHILSKAKAAVESQDGNFNGDVHSGDFDVSVFSNVIKGHYHVTDNKLHLTITDKPFLIPCSTIESFLKSKIS